MVESMAPLVRGLVAGTRKSGTTWLYENFRNDPALRVSEQVKESGYFAGTGPSDLRGYEALFAGSQGRHAVEVDTSVCYSPDAARRILEYNPDMAVALIFRDPEEFLVSRHRHALRKGELAQDDPLVALASNRWLREELDYRKIFQTFDPLHQKGQLAVFVYEELQEDSEQFYARVKRALGAADSETFAPSTTAVNVGRSSKAPFISRLLSDAAKLARRAGAHGIVNKAKALGLHSRLEITKSEAVEDAAPGLREAIERHCPGTLDWFARLRAERIQGQETGVLPADTKLR